jgi:hypothetical protein
MNVIRNMVGLAAVGSMAIACAATVEARPTYEAREECRTVKVHNGRDVEACHTKCHDDVCHTQCKDYERTSRERRCWVE